MRENGEEHLISKLSDDTEFLKAKLEQYDI